MTELDPRPVAAAPGITFFGHLPRLFTRAVFGALGATGRQIRVGDYSVRVHELGPISGEPWVFLHGLAATAAAWLPLLPRLRRIGRLVLPELSEVGGTRGPRPALAVADGVEVTVGLIEALFPSRPVTLAGTSLGGWTAVRLALARPDLAERLILVAPGGYRDQDWERARRAVSVDGPGDAERTVAALFSRPPLPLALFPRSISGLYRTPSVQHLLGAIREEDAFGPEDLSRLTMPVALFWGDVDGIFDVSVGEAMARALPDGHLYRFPGAAHLPHWEVRRELVEALEEFRRLHPPRG